MNSQRKNSADHFRMQSEREQTLTRKMAPITGRASTFLEIFENSNLNPN